MLDRGFGSLTRSGFVEVGCCVVGFGRLKIAVRQGLDEMRRKCFRKPGIFSPTLAA